MTDPAAGGSEGEAHGGDPFTARLLAAAAPELARRRRQVRRRQRIAAAAVLGVLVAGWFLHLRLASLEVDRAARRGPDFALAACERLLSELEQVLGDGGAWRAQDPGLAALALLALARHADPGQDAALRTGARRLAAWLEAELDGDDALPADAPGATDRGLVTLALLESFARTADTDVGRAARLGVTALYRADASPRGAHALPTGAARLAAEWEQAALLSARALGMERHADAAPPATRDRERRELHKAALARLPAAAPLGEGYSASLALLRGARAGD